MGRQFFYMGVALLMLGYGGCSSADSAGAEGFPQVDKSTGEGGSNADVSTPTPARPGGLLGDGTEAAGSGSGGVPDPPFQMICGQSPLITMTMSADDSNSMGSPGYAREMLNSGMAPDPALIRTYEFLNYYNIAYDQPKPDSITITPQLAANDEIPGQYRLQIGVQAAPPASPRRPMTLTLVVDTSQSMAGRGMTNARAVMKEIAGSLQSGDNVSVVTLDAVSKPLINGRIINSAADVAAVVGAATALEAGGGSDLQGGLVRGYSLAHEHFTTGGMNRLVLITDGRANPTAVDPKFIGEHAKQGDDQGIYLVGVGTGPASGYNDALLNGLTDWGRGAYVYIDSEAEAHKMFSERFSEVMDIGARSVSVSMTIPSYFALQRYYGEFIGTPDNPPEPQHLAPGDAMTFNMMIEASDPASFCGDDSLGVTVEWLAPLTLEHRTMTMSATFDELMAADPAPMVKANAVIAYAEALKTLDVKRIEQAQDVIAGAIKTTGGNDKDLEDIQGLLAKHPAVATKVPF